MDKFLSACALAGALLLASAAKAQTIGVPLQVHTGEVYTVQIELTQSTELNERALDATFTQVFALNIVDAENRIWRYTPVSMGYNMPAGLGGETAANVDWAAISDGLSAFLRIATDAGFECRVDEFGRCVEVSNWGLWRDRAENFVLMFDAFARMPPPPPAAAEEGDADESGAAAADESNKDGATTEGQTEETAAGRPSPLASWAVLREPVLRGISRLLDGFDARDAASSMVTIQPGAALQGRSLTRRRTENVVDDVEMPFGAPPLRYTGTMRLERIDRRANTATIVRRVALDQESARASLRSMAQFVTTNLLEPAANAAAGQNAPSSAATGEGAPSSAAAMMGMLNGMLESVDFSYQETTTGILDLASGMVRESTTDFTVTLAPPGGATADKPLELRGRTVMHVTLGAPTVPRLPRGD